MQYSCFRQHVYFMTLVPGQYMERIQKHQFVVSKDNQLMGCLINKVASTSLMATYQTLSGVDLPEIHPAVHGSRTKFVPEVINRE